MKNKKYTFEIYDQKNTTLFSTTINQIEGLLSIPSLFAMLNELLVKIEIEGFKYSLLKGSEENDE